MSATYQAIGWNAFKKRHDIILVIAVVLFLATFIGVALALNPQQTPPILIIRSTAVAAITLLHFILMIGPMARLDKRWLPLLYNRRHLGVTMFLLALIHSAFATLLYHGYSDINPIVSIFVTDAGTSITTFPFQAFGFVALLILFVMAATSHDFWLANLTAPIWKVLHMGVYIAYAFLIIHVAFGVLQSETHPVFAILTGVGVGVVSLLHLIAGWKEKGIDRDPKHEAKDDGYVAVCSVDDLEEDTPFGTTVGGERVAILRYEGNKVSAVSGVCQHQNGPLTEGKFIYGCLTCPWHGYQYKPEDGTSPEPFTEKIPTFHLRVEGNTILIDPDPKPAGTLVEPVTV
ncbi:MAG: Rieske 2Fe-2S domain-containing protein [Verrucomicrobiota bacterium]